MLNTLKAWAPYSEITESENLEINWPKLDTEGKVAYDTVTMPYVATVN